LRTLHPTRVDLFDVPCVDTELLEHGSPVLRAPRRAAGRRW
jgi:hypothetical protein